jgi:hypothetical protein
MNNPFFVDLNAGLKQAIETEAGGRRWIRASFSEFGRHGACRRTRCQPRQDEFLVLTRSDQATKVGREEMIRRWRRFSQPGLRPEPRSPLAQPPSPQGRQAGDVLIPWRSWRLGARHRLFSSNRLPRRAKMIWKFFSVAASQQRRFRRSCMRRSKNPLYMPCVSFSTTELRQSVKSADSVVPGCALLRDLRGCAAPGG